jgi:hypothetical protein
MGHSSDKILRRLFDFLVLDNSCCESCKLEKFTELPFNLSNYKSEKSFDLIHSDVCNPAPIDSFNGYKYFVETQYDAKVKVFRSNNGTKFIN